MLRVLGLLPLVVLLAACTPATAPSPQPPSPPSSPPTRGCDSTAAIDVSAGIAGAPVAGPVTFVPLDYTWATPDPTTAPPTADGGLRLFKIVALVRPGVRATVSIPSEFRDLAKLTYVSLTGTDAVTFVACSVPSIFPGGFGVRAPVCLPVQVSWDGRTEGTSLPLLRPC